MQIFEDLLTKQLTERKSKQHKKILIVEDDRSLRVIFDWLIKDIDPGISYDWFPDGERAEEALLSTAYDIVFSDFMLAGVKTGLDVFEFCSECLPQAEFVIMSSLKLDRFSKAVGANDASPRFLAKPLNVNQVQRIIKQVLTSGEAA